MSKGKTRQPYEPVPDEEKEKLRREIEESESKRRELQSRLDRSGSATLYVKPVKKERYHLELSNDEKAGIFGLSSTIISFIASVYSFYNNSLLLLGKPTIQPIDAIAPSLLIGGITGGLAYLTYIGISSRLRKY
jgi:hypothetical protein